MRCPRCGEKVPFWGQNCPLCHADKSEFQQYAALGFVCAVAGPVVGIVFGGFLGLGLGLLLGGGIWAVTAVIVNQKPPGYIEKKSRNKA
jgi:hypothetical protein